MKKYDFGSKSAKKRYTFIDEIKRNKSRALTGDGPMPSIKIVSAAFILLFLLFSCAFADIRIEGKRDLSYNYIILNMGDYPDYVFLTSSAIWGWKYASIINSSTGSFGGGYKLDSFMLHGIRSEDFDIEKFYRSNSEGYDHETNCEDYCKNNTMIVTANLTLPKSTVVDETIPLDKIVVYLKIDGVTAKTLNLSKTKTVYYYNNGSSQEALSERYNVP